MAHQARTYPSFCSMKRLGVRYFYPRWDASSSQGYPSIKFAGTHWYGEALRELHVSVLLKDTTQCPQSGLKPGPHDPETSALTMRSLHLLPIMRIESGKCSSSERSNSDMPIYINRTNAGKNQMPQAGFEPTTPRSHERSSNH